MTPDQDRGERLRAALARTVDAHTPSPAPVDRILAAGRARRTRRRRAAVTASAAAVLAAALTALPLSLRHGANPAGPAITSVPRPADRNTPAAGPVEAVIGHGTVDGRPWSVTLEFHATLPKGYAPGSPPPGLRIPPHSSLLCQRMVIGGTRIDEQGGPWSDCQEVDGTHDPSESGEGGLWGLYDKGSTSSRLFVGNPGTRVAHGTVTLAGGQQLTASAVTVPGTGYRAWAVAIPGGRTVTSVDEFDTQGHRIGHDTNFH